MDKSCDDAEGKKCAHCKVEFSNDKIIACDGSCKGWFHLKCAGIKDKDFTALSGYTGIKWYCNDCNSKEDELLTIKKVQEMIDRALCSYLEEIKNLKLVIMNGNINNNEKKAYAEAVKAKPIVIKPKVKQQSTKTRNEIKDKIDLKKIEVGGVQINNISEGGIVIKCNNKEDACKLLKEAQDNLGNNYVITRPDLKNPVIKIKGIHEDLSKEEIIECIKKQNDLVLDENSKIEVKFMKELKNGTMVTIEVDTKTFEILMQIGKLNIGWSRCIVTEDLNVWRCYNCSGYNHKARECKNKTRCGKCAGEHPTIECKIEIHRCINCITANEKFNLKLDTNHQSFDKACTIYQRKLERYKLRTTYA